MYFLNITILAIEATPIILTVKMIGIKGEVPWGTFLIMCTIEYPIFPAISKVYTSNIYSPLSSVYRMIDRFEYLLQKHLHGK